MQNELRVMNMRTSSPTKPYSLTDKIVDGAFLSALVVSLLLIGAMYGYLLAKL